MAYKRADIRKILEDESLDNDAKTSKLLDLHHADVDVIRDERDEIQKNLNDMKKENETMKAAKEKAEKQFSDFKAEQDKQASRSSKEAAYKKQLEKSGIKDEKAVSSILRATNFDDVEFNEKGEIKDEKAVQAAIKDTWGGFVEHTQGQTVTTPPNGGKGYAGMTKEAIAEIKDTTERQQAMAENAHLYGLG